MDSDFEQCVNTTPIVIDDDAVSHSTTTRTTDVNSTESYKSIQYDDTKLATSCFAQFFVKCNTDTNSAICLLCKVMVKKSGDSTFNFVRHVKRHHLDAYNTWSKRLATKEEKTQAQQPSIKIAMTSPRGTKYASNHPRQVELSKMVTHDLIIGLALPLSIVERAEFLHAMHTVDHRFLVPSRRALCRDVLPKEVEKVENEMKRICRSSDFVSLTLDLWSDRRMRSFIGVTIHLIDENLFKSHLLAFKHLSGNLSNNLVKSSLLIRII